MREWTQEEWTKFRESAEPLFAAEMRQALGLPDVLISYQKTLLETTSVNPVTVVSKSRRTGMTWGAAADAVLTAAMPKGDGGMDVFYIGFNLDMAREFIDTCGKWAKAFNSVATAVEEYLFTEKDATGEHSILAFRITFATGHEIVALTSKPRSLRGRQGYVIIDEAAFHDALDELLKAALALLMWGGKVLIISTHDGDTNPFNVLVEDIKKGRKPYALIELDFDEALIGGLYQRICLVQGKTWSAAAEAAWRQEITALYGTAADEELYCIPSNGSGSFLAAILIERAQRKDIPVLRWSCEADFLQLGEAIREAEADRFIRESIEPALALLDPGLSTCLGEDFAMVGDLTVFVPMQISQDMRRRSVFAVELRAVPYAQQKQILFHIIQRLPNFLGACMDATGNGAPLAQETALEFGLEKIVQVMINPGWYRDVALPFKAAFEDGTIEVPGDIDVYNDLRSIKLVRGIAHIERQPKSTGKGEDSTKGRRAQRHGDSAIALLMAYTASRLNLGQDGMIHFLKSMAANQEARKKAMGIGA